MNADTVQHGSFGVFQVFTVSVDLFSSFFPLVFFFFFFFFVASLSRYNTIHTYDSKGTVFTDLVYIERKTY